MQATSKPSWRPSRPGGFTLVELLVSFTVLAILLVVISTMLEHIQSAWRQTSARVSSFREARRAFDRITHALGQAELNTYLCYRYANSADPLVPPAKSQASAPLGYVRYSELQFVSGPSSSSDLTGLNSQFSPGHAVFFQAPLGISQDYRLPSSLNGCGFFVRFGDDTDLRPSFLTALGKAPSYRYRLYEYRSPTEENRVYDPALKSGTTSWFADFAETAPLRSRAIANNIVLLVISPQVSPADAAFAKKSPTHIAPAYTYDSGHGGMLASGQQSDTDYQLPPLVMVTLVAIDEASAENLQFESGGNAPLTQEVSAAGLFKDAKKYRADLETVGSSLSSRKINYRVFTATVPIRASKWGQGTGT